VTQSEFSGFKPEIFAFLRDLEQNNNREWFAEYRDRYENDYLAPAMDFVNAMYEAAAALTPPHKAVAKINGSVRRINRDVRFSKDKSPYNARLHLVFWTGDHPNRSPAIHLILDPESIGFGAGQWAFSADQIDQYRNAISKPASRKGLSQAVERANAVGCEMGLPELKKIPKGFDESADWSSLLRHKSIVCRTFSRVQAPDEMFTPHAASYFTNLFAELAPLNAWINKCIS
jgi:uncharacterized protein (TIGR02453 family)